jgi:hypothetical protein
MHARRAPHVADLPEVKSNRAPPRRSRHPAGLTGGNRKGSRRRLHPRQRAPRTRQRRRAGPVDRWSSRVAIVSAPRRRPLLLVQRDRARRETTARRSSRPSPLTSPAFRTQPRRFIASAPAIIAGDEVPRTELGSAADETPVGSTAIAAASEVRSKRAKRRIPVLSARRPRAVAAVRRASDNGAMPAVAADPVPVRPRSFAQAPAALCCFSCGCGALVRAD